MALTRAEIDYKIEFLHYSKHDVKYLFTLYKKLYEIYQLSIRNDIGIINEKTKIIHATECRYTKNCKVGYAGIKALIFKGYRVCSCCGDQMNLKKIRWKAVKKKATKKSKRRQLRNLPLTERNIERICNNYHITCNISDHIVFLTTNCGYWRLYLDGDKVTKVYHGNYKIYMSDFHKKQKWNEDFHQQKISHTNFYDVVTYIFYHDRNVYTYDNKTKVEALLEELNRNGS